MQIQKFQKKELKNSLKYLFLKLNKISFILLLSVSAIWVISNFFAFSITQEEENEQFNNEYKNNYSVFSIDIPENLNFAEEKIPLEYFDVYETIDKEFTLNIYWQSQTILFIKRANKYFPIIEPILKKNNIPNDFKYLAVAESGLVNITSPAGAKGFWQFMEGTAKEYNLEINDEVDERYNLEKSTQAACNFFNSSFKKFKNWTLVAASYNMGIGGLNNQISRQYCNNYWDLLLNTETARYVNRIVAIKTIMNDPDKFGFHIKHSELYTPINTYEIAVDSTINDFGIFAFKQNINYKMLKIFNPWLRDNKLTNKNKKEYKILIPKDLNRNFNIPDSLKTEK